MFVEMPKEKEELIKHTGQLCFREHPFAEPNPRHNKMEYVVTYNSKQFDCYPTSIFHCVVTYTGGYLAIEDLCLRTKGVSPLSEDSLYLFLGWMLEDAPKWAKAVGKSYVFVQTKLPHCTEWFVRHNYDILSAERNGYRGFRKC